MFDKVDGAGTGTFGERQFHGRQIGQNRMGSSNSKKETGQQESSYHECSSECGRLQQKIVATKPRVLSPFDNLSSPPRFEGSSPISLSYMLFFEQRSDIVSTISILGSGSRSGRSGAATRGYLN